MIRKFKSINVALAVILISTMSLSGCKPKQVIDDKTAAKTFSFSVTLPSSGADDSNTMVQKAWLKEMETKMGMKLNIKFNYIPAGEYDEKAKLMISSNDLTDVFVTPFLADTKPLAKQGMLLELSQYSKLMPNYLNYVNKATDGKIKAYNEEGKMFVLYQGALPRFPADMGMLPNNMSSYRYDLFQKDKIKIPETLDEVYAVAKQLKQLYPDKYPINTRFQGLNSVFYANHTANEIYWNGKEYVNGIQDDAYKQSLLFLNKLYSEKLLDPEYLLETNDTIKKKALNGSNFMWLNEWFTSPGAYTHEAKDGKVFAVTLFPDNPSAGKSWQSVQDVNNYDLSTWGAFVIKAQTKEPENLVKFCDLQYSDDVTRLVTWGIEGTTYNIGSDGKPTFVDSIKKSADPWAEGDKYGMRAATKSRPGLQMAADSSAYVDLAPNDYVILNGQYKEVPLEKSDLLKIPFPKNDYMPPWINGPQLQFTDAENQQISTVMTSINTYRDEMQSKFIKGTESFNNWDKFQTKLKGMGDIEKILVIYNDTAKRYTEKKAKLYSK